MSDYTELFRMVERLAVTLFGGLSIVLGFKLLQSGVLDVTSGEWSGLGFRVRLTRASPGIFFCALGAIILIRAIDARVSVERDESSVAAPAAVRPVPPVTDEPASQPAVSAAGRPVPPASDQPQPVAPAVVPPVPPAADQPAAPTIVQKTRFLGVADSREWDRVIASTNLAIRTLQSTNAPGASDLTRLRDIVLRAAFGDEDYDFYVSVDRPGTETMAGEDRAKWLALDRRARRMPTEGDGP